MTAPEEAPKESAIAPVALSPCGHGWGAGLWMGLLTGMLEPQSIPTQPQGGRFQGLVTSCIC